MKLYRMIKLHGKRGGFTKVSVCDFELVSKLKWYCESHGYVRQLNGRKFLFLHRFILGLGRKIPLVDHIDGDPLNNCRSNLRLATSSENQQNRRPNKTRRYKGVFYRDEKSFLNPWEAKLGFKGISYHIGRFASARAAAFAYNIFAKEFFGAYAKLNNVTFPKKLVIH